MSGFEMAEPFDIDSGELDELSPRESFTLGVEWEKFRARLLNESGDFSTMVHAANADRLCAMCRRHGRQAKVRWVHDDHSAWRVIEVSGEDGNAIRE